MVALIKKRWVCLFFVLWRRCIISQPRYIKRGEFLRVLILLPYLCLSSVSPSAAQQWCCVDRKQLWWPVSWTHPNVFHTESPAGCWFRFRCTAKPLQTRWEWHAHDCLYSSLCLCQFPPSNFKTCFVGPLIAKSLGMTHNHIGALQ